MTKNNLKIVFFGTPEFAVESLKRLVENNFNICAVVTAPDKQAGRGQHFAQSEVKKFAVEHGLRIMQPEKLKDEKFVDELRAINADLFIVIAFRMLPEVVGLLEHVLSMETTRAIPLQRTSLNQLPRTF